MQTILISLCSGSCDDFNSAKSGLSTKSAQSAQSAQSTQSAHCLDNSVVKWLSGAI